MERKDTRCIDLFWIIERNNKRTWSYILLQCYFPLSARDSSVFGNIWFAPLHFSLLLQ
jgi:hypothetical protein